MIESEANIYSKRRVYSVTVKIAVVISQIIHLGIEISACTYV